MKAPKAPWMLTAFLATICAVGPLATAQPLGPGPHGGAIRFVPREIVVFPHHPAQSRALAQRMRAEGFLVLATAPISGMVLAATPMEGIEVACIGWLKTWPEVRTAEQNQCGQSTSCQPVPDCPYDIPVAGPCSATTTGLPYPDLQLASPCPTPAPGDPNDPDFCLQWTLKNTGQQIVDRSNTIWAGTPPAYFGECWEQTALPGIDVNALPAWQRTTGNAAVVVAILDSGTEYCNPDFDQSRFLLPDIALTCVGHEEFGEFPCCNFAIDPPCVFGPARDNRGHGTVVASIVGAEVNNGIGIAGIDQHCRILSARIGGTGGTGPGGINFTAVNTARAVVALEMIAADPVYADVRVINMSFALEPACGACDQITAFEDAVNLLVQQNRFVVAAAGNDGVGSADLKVPSAFPSAITVGGIDSRGWKVGSSSTGLCLDFVAPGMAHVALICQSNPCPDCPYPTNPCEFIYQHNFLTGTSFAAPMVCGAISLILARAIELGIVNSQTWTGLTWTDMYDILRQGARDQVSHVPGHAGDPNDTAGWDSHYGWGLIDIDASLEYLETHYPCSNPPC